MKKKIKCHIKKEEINPYPKFSKQCDKPAFRIEWRGWGNPSKKQLEEVEQEYHTDGDWLLWQLKHGKSISSSDLK
jgi:hypothetical protein